MKIDTKPLSIGKNSINVDASWSQVDQADAVMIAMYTVSANPDDMVKSLQAEREAMKKAMSFLKNLLGLTAKQSDSVFKHVDANTLNLYISYVCGLIKGAPEESFEKFKKDLDGQTGPKEQSVKSDEQ